MKIKTKSSETLPSFGDANKFSLSFHGVSVDERGENSIKLCEESSVVHCTFTHERNTYTINQKQIDLGALRTRLRDKDRILVDCTTLGVVEIIFIIRAARAEKISNLTFLYAEPGEYSREEREGLASATRFSLTRNRQFSAVHGVSIDLSCYSKGQAIFMLGYEEDRLAMLLTQQENLAQFEKYAIFGVPAFAAGWELDSFSNHASNVANERFKVLYAGANSVSDSYQKLADVHQRKGQSDLPTVIAPIGTKPHAIAAALFLCTHSEHNDSVLIYDHPQKKDGRSRKVKRWHVYDITLPS